MRVFCVAFLVVLLSGCSRQGIAISASLRNFVVASDRGGGAGAGSLLADHDASSAKEPSDAKNASYSKEPVAAKAEDDEKLRHELAEKLLPDERRGRDETLLGALADVAYTVRMAWTHIPSVFETENKKFHDTFLPMWRFQFVIFMKANCTVSLSLLWLMIYFFFLYGDDRSQSLDRWRSSLDALGRPVAAEDAQTAEDERGLHPDLILVFHHPDYDYPDSEDRVKHKSLKRIRPNSSQDGMSLLAERLKLGEEDLEEAKHGSLSTSLTGGFFHKGKSDLSRKAVRTALLKDIYALAPARGFSVTAFSSIDGDELYVAVTLCSAQAIVYYTDKRGIKLQLRDDIASIMGIQQDPQDPCSSPAYIPYDRHVLQGLNDCGVVSSMDSAALFREYVGSFKGSAISSLECIKIVYNELSCEMDLGAAQEEELLVDWYPVHNPQRIEELRAMWASWWKVLDPSFRQPIPFLRDYFGPRVAFLFAWSGTYCKGLLALNLVAVFQVVMIFVLNTVFDIHVLKPRQVIGFTIVVMIWAKIMVNLWTREETFYLELWHLAENEKDIIRPQFIGESKPSELDTNITEMTYPAMAASYRKTVSSCVTIIMTAFVAICIFGWMVAFEGKMNLYSSILLAVMIKLFGIIFRSMAILLTDYENHKFQDDYHNNLLWKLFLFEFVNNYSAFFFLTLWGKWKDAECVNGDCLHVLRFQLATTLTILILCSIVQVFFQELTVNLRLYWELVQYRRKFGKEPPTRLPFEEQSKYIYVDEQEEVLNTLTLMITLGYVLIFGGCSPIILPLCFLVYAVQLRSFAIFFSYYAQRPLPQNTRGIGNWSGVVRFLMNVGVLYSGFLFAAYGSSFRDASLMAKMTGFLIFCLGICVGWNLVDFAFPENDGKALLLANRREYVVTKLMLKAESADLAGELQEAIAAEKLQFVEEINEGEWSKIPPLCEQQAVQ